MFVLFFLVYSLAATCSSLLNANVGTGKGKFPYPEPRNLLEARDLMKKYIEEKYTDPSEQFIARDINADWCFMCAVLQGAQIEKWNKELKEKKMLKTKLSLRREVTQLFEWSLEAPFWLREITLKERYKWRLLLQLGTGKTELLKRIITQQMNLTVDQFSNDMEEFMRKSVRGTRGDWLPHFECEEELDEMLCSLGFTEDSLRKSVIAVIYRFRNENHAGLFKRTSAQDIVDFLNIYSPLAVHCDNVTIIEKEIDDEEESSPNYLQAFIRFNKTIENERSEEFRNLKLICSEIEKMTQSSIPQMCSWTIEMPEKKAQFVQEFCNSTPLIFT